MLLAKNRPVAPLVARDPQDLNRHDEGLRSPARMLFKVFGRGELGRFEFKLVLGKVLIKLGNTSMIR